LAEKLGPRNREYRDYAKAGSTNKFESTEKRYKGKTYTESPEFFRGKGRIGGGPSKKNYIVVGESVVEDVSPFARRFGQRPGIKKHYVSDSEYREYEKQRDRALKKGESTRRRVSLLAARRQSRMRQDQARTQAARGKRAAYASLLSGYDSGGIG